MSTFTQRVCPEGHQYECIFTDCPTCFRINQLIAELATAYREHDASIAELAKQLASEREARQKAESELTRVTEPWDDGETVWTVPTAWAYAQACKVVNGRELTAEQERDELRAHPYRASPLRAG